MSRKEEEGKNEQGQSLTPDLKEFHRHQYEGWLLLHRLFRLFEGEQKQWSQSKETEHLESQNPHRVVQRG